jgi:hypothetical protein
MNSNEDVILSTLEGVVKPSTELLYCKKIRYAAYPIPDGKGMVVVRPLPHLVSLPLQTRRRIHSPLYFDQARDYSADTPLQNMLKAATHIIKQKFGEERSIRWMDRKYDHANSVVMTEGVLGLFHGMHSLVRINEDSNRAAFEIEAELQFDFFDGFHTIAKRSTKFGDVVEYLGQWQVNPEFQELFDWLKRLYELPHSSKLHTWTDIFLWTDQDLFKFPDSLVKKAVHDAISSFGRLKPNRGIALLFITIYPESSKGIKKKLASLERLSIQRFQGPARIIWAPGVDQRQSSSQQPIYRLEEIIDSKMEKGTLQRLESLGLQLPQLFTHEPNEMLHTGHQDATNESFIVISSECWTGTWSDSLEIEGEHLMS